MQPVNQIREILEKFLAQPDHLESFVSAFSAASFDIHRHGEPSAIRLADKVESYLADVRAGFLSVSDLHGSLRELLSPAPVGYYYAISLVAFSRSVNQPAVVEKAFPVQSSGTSPSVVFGSANLVRV